MSNINYLIYESLSGHLKKHWKKYALGLGTAALAGSVGHKLLKPKKSSLGKKLAIGTGIAAGTVGTGYLAHKYLNKNSSQNNSKSAFNSQSKSNINDTIQQNLKTQSETPKKQQSVNLTKSDDYTKKQHLRQSQKRQSTSNINNTVEHVLNNGNKKPYKTYDINTTEGFKSFINDSLEGKFAEKISGIHNHPSHTAAFFTKTGVKNIKNLDKEDFKIIKTNLLHSATNELSHDPYDKRHHLILKRVIPDYDKVIDLKHKFNKDNFPTKASLDKKIDGESKHLTIKTTLQKQFLENPTRQTYNELIKYHQHMAKLLGKSEKYLDDYREKGEYIRDER